MNKLNEYYSLLRATEAKVEKARNKRTIKTILFFSALYFIAFYLIDKPDGLDILWTYLGSVVIGGLHFFVNAFVFSTLHTRSESENKNVEQIKNRIKELELSNTKSNK